jgi:hypothetical protein
LNQRIDIRKLYSPSQPAVENLGETISYTEFLPHQGIQGFIYCYWQLKTNQILPEMFNYRVVADGCIDIFFELDNPAESYVMGFCRQYTEFPLGHSFNYIGIRFFPSFFPQLFDLSSECLRDKFECLDNVVPQVSNFIRNNICAEQSQYEIVQKLNQYFLKLISNKVFAFDNRFYRAFALILDKAGDLDIEKDLDTGVSSRQLRRLFQFYIGDTPKVFSNIVRFQNILNSRLTNQNFKENKAFLDCGYYDQAHFIKDFKRLSGITPGKAFDF